MIRLLCKFNSTLNCAPANIKMVLKFNFSGPMAPVFTPFLKDSSAVNTGVIPKYAEFLKKSGIKGVLVNGTAGEGVNMTVEERKLVLEEWIKAAKRNEITVMAQIGGRSLGEVLELAKHAEEKKADAILCLPELFFKPRTVAELTSYLQFVSSAAPKTPLFYYHIPFFTGVTLDMAEFLKFSEDKIPTLAGIKFTHNNLQEGAECLSVNRSKFTVFLGNEQMLAGACILGFDSCLIIGINLVPNVVTTIMDSVKNNKNETALKYQNILTDVMAVIMKYGLIPGGKAAMSIITGLEMGNPRLPLGSLNEKQFSSLRSEIKFVL